MNTHQVLFLFHAISNTMTQCYILFLFKLLRIQEGWNFPSLSNTMNLYTITGKYIKVRLLFFFC